MALLLILPILVSGYLLCLKHPALYINLHKFDGQLLYLHVARLGLRCLVQAFVLVGVVSALLSHAFSPKCWFEGTRAEFCRTASWNLDYLDLVGNKLKDWGFASTQGAADLFAFMLVVSAVAVAIPFVLPRYEMWKLKRNKGLANGDALNVHMARTSAKSSPLGLALIEAFANRREIMLSMDDRKVYVGILAEISPPSEVLGPNEEIIIVPVLSGYRDKDTLRVVYTTDYTEKAAANASISFSPVILRQSAIVSLTTFSPAIRKAFEESNDSVEKTTKIEVPKGAQYCIWGADEGQAGAARKIA